MLEQRDAATAAGTIASLASWGEATRSPRVRARGARTRRTDGRRAVCRRGAARQLPTTAQAMTVSHGRPSLGCSTLSSSAHLRTHGGSMFILSLLVASTNMCCDSTNTCFEVAEVQECVDVLSSYDVEAAILWG